MDRLLNKALYYVNHMDQQDWLLALAVVVVIGFYCMRGFGSRSSY